MKEFKYGGPLGRPGTSCMKARLVKRSWMPSEGSEIFHRSPLKWKQRIHAIRWDEGKEFTIAEGTKVCSLHFRLEDLRKSFYGRAYVVRRCCNTICLVSIFPKKEKSSSWKTSSASKEKVVYVRVHSHRIARNKYYGGSNSTAPVVETSESIQPNDNNSELNAIGYREKMK